MFKKLNFLKYPLFLTLCIFYTIQCFISVYSSLLSKRYKLCFLTLSFKKDIQNFAFFIHVVLIKMSHREKDV